jgi:catechol 2,3-dioxygenase-like lactoylglutathione lyase family enzyme
VPLSAARGLATVEASGIAVPAPSCEGERVAVTRVHVIVPVNDAAESLRFYRDVLGFVGGEERPPFTIVRVSASCILQLAPWGTEGNMHLAFAMSGAEFDAVFARIRRAGVPFGDAFHDSDNLRGPGDEDGARGHGKAVYLMDPNRHLIEIRHYPGE